MLASKIGQKMSRLDTEKLIRTEEPNVYLTYLKTKAFLCLLTFPEKYVNINVEASDKLKIVSNAYDQVKDPFYEYILLSMVDFFCGKHNHLKIHY